MDSAKIEAFFSCSFGEGDKDVNDVFQAICRALDIQCINVGTGYTKTPPEKAKEMVSKTSGVIAICTKRSETKDGKYLMPTAVHDEISFAYGMDLPVLMFVEEGVQLDGFKNNYGTHLRFYRDSLNSPETFEKIISAIHCFKMDLISPHELTFDQNTSEFFAEYSHILYELKENGNDFYWLYSNTKKLIFQKPYKRSFRTGAWATVPSIVPASAEPIKWEINVENSSRNLEIKTSVEQHTAECFEALLKIDPYPEEEDFIEFSTITSSRYFNPIWDEELKNGPQIYINDKTYKSFDGTVFIQRTKKAFLEFRFPRSYGLTKHDIEPFVGSYTSNVDYLVESELQRAKINVDSFAGNIAIRMQIDSPLLRHIYGVAWNPPRKKKK